MTHRLIVPIAALLLGLAAGMAPSVLSGPVLAEDQKGAPGHYVDDADATVTAHRYEMVVYDSAMDFVHAHGRTIVELHFPHAGIVCNLEGAPMQGVVMNAFFGEPRFRLDAQVIELLGDKAPKQSEPEEVELPASLFVRIKNLAETQRDLNEYASELKKDLGDTGLFARKE